MRTATFIEKSRKDQNVSQIINKRIFWKTVFDTLRVGSVFTAEFGEGGKTMDFRVIKIINDPGDAFELSESKTFWIEIAP